MMDFKEATFIRLDLFPAAILDITDSEEPILVSKDMRLIVTNDMVYIFKEGISGIEVHYSAFLSEFIGTNKTGYTVKTADEKIFSVTRAANCGCGSRLRAFFPFPGVPFVSQLR